MAVVAIRHPLPGEIDALAAIGLAAWRKGIGPHVDAATSSRIGRENPFLPFLTAIWPRFLVGTVGGRPAGIGASELQDDCISDLWVAPEFEGRGVATALVGALESEIAARGYRFARLHVLAVNERARGLYEHLGYREVERGSVTDPVLRILIERIGLSKSLG